MGSEIPNTAETPSLKVPSLLLSHLTKLTHDQLENLIKEGISLLQPHALVGVLSETLTKFHVSNVKDVEQLVFPMFSFLEKDIKTAKLTSCSLSYVSQMAFLAFALCS